MFTIVMLIACVAELSLVRLADAVSKNAFGVAIFVIVWAVVNRHKTTSRQLTNSSFALLNPLPSNTLVVRRKSQVRNYLIDYYDPSIGKYRVEDVRSGAQLFLRPREIYKVPKAKSTWVIFKHRGELHQGKIITSIRAGVLVNVVKGRLAGKIIRIRRRNLDLLDVIGSPIRLETIPEESSL
jgi:hypothetical protein